MVEQAITLNPNLAIAWYSRGWVSLMCGELQRSIVSFDRMIRLSPVDPLRIGALMGSSLAFFGLGRYEEGYLAGSEAIQFRGDAQSLGGYIINSVRSGKSSEARNAVMQLLELEPDFRASYAHEAYPMRSPDERNRIVAALRDAGLPE